MSQNVASSSPSSSRAPAGPPPGPEACPACGSTAADTALADARDYEYGVPGEFRFARCASCALVFLSPRPTLEQIVSYYPAEYHAYQRPTSRLFRLLDRLQYGPRVRRYRRLLPETGRVLDVGCGDGSLLREIGRRGPWELYGLDFKPEALPASDPAARPLHLFAGTLEQAPYERDFFDLVVMHHVLEHVPEPATTLRKVLEILRPGGTLVGQLPNYDSIERLVTGRYWNGYHTPRHMQCFSRRTLGALLSRTGFADVRTSPALHPGQWALSIQGWLAGRWLTRTRLAHGKAWFYPGCLLAGIPLTIVETAVRRSGVMNFVARKP
ncbi:MAG: class I SAM-dependent methyltransferase [Planctomycetales bacterium]|nr:class I SAM-dependent methyltransferase [Planctomycetales bacterium]